MSSQTSIDINNLANWIARRSILVPLCLLFAAGCSHQSLDDTIPVAGCVVYEGEPLTVGEVRYMPLDDANGRVARGQLDKYGRFELTTLHYGDGALPGEYRVVVIVFADDTDGVPVRNVDESERIRQQASNVPPIPLRYYSPDTSGLTDTVNDEHTESREFKLIK